MHLYVYTYASLDNSMLTSQIRACKLFACRYPYRRCQGATKLDHMVIGALEEASYGMVKNAHTYVSFIYIHTYTQTLLINLHMCVYIHRSDLLLRHAVKLIKCPSRFGVELNRQ